MYFLVVVYDIIYTGSSTLQRNSDKNLFKSNLHLGIVFKFSKKSGMGAGLGTKIQDSSFSPSKKKCAQPFSFSFHVLSFLHVAAPLCSAATYILHSMMLWISVVLKNPDS